jgi:hypothetical protein
MHVFRQYWCFLMSSMITFLSGVFVVLIFRLLAFIISNSQVFNIFLINCNKINCILYFLSLKGQCHENFEPRFFRQSITPRPQINTLKYFRILF